MLNILIPEIEVFDNNKQEFVTLQAQGIALEHSLISVSKWEGRWNTPFLAQDRTMTKSQMADYFSCMTLTKRLPSVAYQSLSTDIVQAILEYIELPMTALHLPKEKKKAKIIYQETITSELIYFLMVQYGIPFECEKWHLNRLLSLISLFEFKTTPPEELSKREIMERNRELNAKRRKELGTKG